MHNQKKMNPLKEVVFREWLKYTRRCTKQDTKKEISQNKEGLWVFYPAEMPTIIEM